MRSALIFTVFIALLSVNFAQAQVIMGPLDYNTNKQQLHSLKHTGPQQIVNPSGSNRFFPPDTLNLPFLDDFSTDRYTSYDAWEYPAPKDSVRAKYRVFPAPAQWPLNYKTTPAYTYLISGSAVDSFQTPVHEIVFYNDSLNPFRPSDTLTVWEFSPFRLVYNENTQLVDTIPQLFDGFVTADTTDTIRVFFPLNDGSVWLDHYTYRNNTMAKDPPSWGVATFDGTDEFGAPYDFQPSAYGRADRLTSKPIDLSYPASDSVYLSFWVQPQGLGYAPSPQDSLVLEFLDPVARRWNRRFALPGDSVRDFRPILIPIVEPQYLRRGFQFRFVNYANRSGNQDHWSIDYVELDRFRTFDDTLLEDVALVQVQPHFLRFYTAMPWTQVTMPEIEQKWRNQIANRDDVPRVISYGFEVRDTDGNLFNQYPQDYNPLPSDTNIIQPYLTSGYASYSRWSQPDFTYDFANGGYFPLQDSATFTVKHILTQLNADKLLDNDTITVTQPFHNYFAYDDGTAEVAVWLGVPGSFAVKFRNNFADTLYGISMYFSPVKENNLNRNIDLTVWKSLDDDPLYTERVRIGVSPLDNDARRIYENNGFTTYVLEEPLPLSSGPFYVGWTQNQIFKVNLGFDRNNDASNNTFYRIYSNWDTLDLGGAAMIRPLVANDFRLNELNQEPLLSEERMQVFPNPNQGMVHVQTGAEIASWRLVDLSGREVSHGTANPGQHSFHLPGVPQGMYVFEITTQEGHQFREKLLMH